MLQVRGLHSRDQRLTLRCMVAFTYRQQRFGRSDGIVVPPPEMPSVMGVPLSDKNLIHSLIRPALNLLVNGPA